MLVEIQQVSEVLLQNLWKVHACCHDNIFALLQGVSPPIAPHRKSYMFKSDGGRIQHLYIQSFDLCSYVLIRNYLTSLFEAKRTILGNKNTQDDWRSSRYQETIQFIKQQFNNNTHIGFVWFCHKIGCSKTPMVWHHNLS